MIRLGRIVKDYQDAGAFNSLVNVQSALDEHTWLTKSGQLLSVVSVQAVDDECFDPAERNQVARRFEASLRVFDDRFRIYQYRLKGEPPSLPERAPGHPAVQEAIRERAAFFSVTALSPLPLESRRPLRPKKSDGPTVHGLRRTSHSAFERERLFRQRPAIRR